jgi:hypothetical protein
MKRSTKIWAAILLGIGVPISLIGAIEVLRPQATPEDREGGLAALVLFGLPPTALGTWLIWSSRRQGQKAESDRLRSTFFRTLQANNGHITVLLFSMETGLEGADAKAYLDERAKEFNAAYDVTEEGSYSYYFNLGNHKELGSGS